MFRFFQPEKTNDAHYTVLMNDLHQTAQDPEASNFLAILTGSSEYILHWL